MNNWEIDQKLKATPEQEMVVGPLVSYLVEIGWNLGQIVFGKSEWFIPKTPSEATHREKGQSFSGFPVDIAIFDDPANVGDPSRLLILIECKQPTEDAGVTQLESYYTGEPNAILGIWANDPDPSADAIFLYRDPDGRLNRRSRKVADIPRPGEEISVCPQRVLFGDLVLPTQDTFKKTMEDLLDRIVVGDSNVNHREEQLDQLCNLLLLKLENDKDAKSAPDSPVFFRPLESVGKTAKALRSRYDQFVQLYPEVFVTDQDKVLRFSDDTIAGCVDKLHRLKLIDLSVEAISLAFQVLRSEALKQREGQYFTPQAVIEAGVRLMQIKFEDIVLDPACGTGGFLVEAMRDLKRSRPAMQPQELSSWAQTHIHGIDKDAIGIKLAKAVMQIVGDGSAHCARGDSIRTHTWQRDFPYLQTLFSDGRFTAIITNPPFGQNLKVSAADSRRAGLELAKREDGTYQDLEIGLLFLERSYHLLKEGGRVGIVLPETYFFSSTYDFLFKWLELRLRPVVVANIPMEAFQGFCRAKTNFYVFEKIKRNEQV